MILIWGKLNWGYHTLGFDREKSSILGIRLRDLSLLSRIQNHRETKKYDSQEIYIFSGENISAYMKNLFRNLKSSGKVLYICLLFVCHTWGQTLNARTDFYLFLPPLSVQTWQSEMAIRIKIFEIFFENYLFATLEDKLWTLGLIFTFFCHYWAFKVCPQGWQTKSKQMYFKNFNSDCHFWLSSLNAQWWTKKIKISPSFQSLSLSVANKK